MLQRTILHKTLPRLSNLLRPGHVNSFCSGPRKVDDDAPPTEEKKEGNFQESDVGTPSKSEEISRLLEDSATFSDVKDSNWATTPYPKDVPIPDQKDQKPKIDPNDTSIVMFPGQGTLKVGKVEKYLRFPNARELFDIANEVLGYNLLKLCLNGPQEKLNQTQFNQPATVVMSLAALEKLREERPRVFETCVATLGYSVGELTSLIFSGAITFEDGLRLVSVRGQAMQSAADKVPQGMLSVFCKPSAELGKACLEARKWAQDLGVVDPVCKVAIYLYTQSKILAGHKEALQFIEMNSSKFGLTKLTRLPVSGAFHTPLMEPALQAFSEVLRTVEIDTPRCNVYSNYKATSYSTPKKIKAYLIKQIVSPVKWEQIIHLLYSRHPDIPHPRTFDVGSEGRMKTILKLINEKAANSCLVV